MDTKKLRQKILDLAIHGKLVPQDPNDEPASVLLERIRSEKERLIKEGKIKRSRKTTKTSDAACDEQEVPFEVPNGWVWCRLGEVNDIARGGSPRPIKDYLTNSKNGVNWIKIGDTTKDGKYINSVKEKIRVEGVTKSRMVHKGDFLLTNSMSFGRPYILNVDGCIHDGWLVISPIGKVYSSDFLYYLLSSSFALNQFTQVASGGVVSNLNSDKVADTMFPIAPLAEQQRIVEEIECWFKLIDIIEQGKADLQTTIKQAKNKILDLAIHGKLVPQDPNDEPASELLKRINPKAEITCDNGHYPKLPKGW
ncbi:restriction endonuclease subunit S, partial [Prevotella sp.]|uniref:restriction endonuclease subunit S n=1 Tax=Prevotella sp. TaxID=59823 RepID=UPI001CAAE153